MENNAPMKTAKRRRFVLGDGYDFVYSDWTFCPKTKKQSWSEIITIRAWDKGKIKYRLILEEIPKRRVKK